MLVLCLIVLLEQNENHMVRLGGDVAMCLFEPLGMDLVQRQKLLHLCWLLVWIVDRCIVGRQGVWTVRTSARTDLTPTPIG